MIDNLSDETYIFINSVNRRVAIERLQRAGTEWKTGRYEDLRTASGRGSPE